MLLDWHLERNLINVLINQIFIQINTKIFFSTKFDPNIDSGLFLNVTNNWIEFKVFFRFIWLDNFETHWNLTIIVKYKFFSVNMIQKTNLKIIQSLLNTNRNLSASTNDLEFYWRWVDKITYVNLKLCLENPNLSWNELKVQYFFRISTDFRSHIKFYLA